MKITCGTDIIEIERVKQSIDKYGDKFLKKIFTEEEIRYCESHKENKYQHYAARFASKEAVYKALSSLLTQDELTWNKIEIVNDKKNGKPKVNINNNKIESIDISISHCKSYAISVVNAIIK